MQDSGNRLLKGSQEHRRRKSGHGCTLTWRVFATFATTSEVSKLRNVRWTEGEQPRAPEINASNTHTQSGVYELSAGSENTAGEQESDGG